MTRTITRWSAALGTVTAAALLLPTAAALAQEVGDSAAPLSPEVAPAAADAAPLDTVAVPDRSEPAVVASVPSRGKPLEEVIVTASRRVQAVQDVVGGIQVFSGADLEAAGAGNFQDYVTQIPGAGLREDGSGGAKIGIRGVSNVSGNQIGTFSGASPVGIYLNDVPIQGSGQLPDLDLYDLTRIEVLKGPQGTLYGEGAMGGAVRMLVNQPSLTRSDFKAESGLSHTEDGGFNESLKVAGGMPIIDEVLGVRAVAVVKHDSGFIDFTSQNRPDANSSSAQSLRVLATYRPVDKASAELLYLHDHSHQFASSNVRPDTEQQLQNDAYEPEFSKPNFDLGGVTLKYDFDDFQLSSVSAALRAERTALFRLPLLKSTVQGDLPSIPGGVGLLDPAQLASLVFDVAQIKQEPYNDHTRDVGFSQELRLVSSGDHRLNWVAGAYYQQRDQHYDQTLYVYQSPIPGEDRQLHRVGVQSTQQFSIYGEGVYKVVPSLDLTLGLRAFREKIGIDDLFQTYGAFAYLQAAAGDQNPKHLEIEHTDSNFLPKASLGWHLSKDQMVYALASRGYRTTTPNVQAQLGVGPPLLKPDFLWNYELGTKSQWLDHRLTVNASVYYIDWKNLQASRLGSGHLGAVPVDIIYIDNIGDAQVKGAELEVLASLGAGFSVGLGGAYQDGKIVHQTAGSVALPGSRIPNSPKWSGTVNLGYATSLFDHYTLSATTVLQYVGSQSSVEVTATDPTGSQTLGYRKLGAQLALDDAHWGVTLFGDNLLNERIELQNASLVETEHFTTLGRPRTLGLRLRVSFGG